MADDGRIYKKDGPYRGLVKRTSDGPRWTGEVRLVEEVLDLPLRWRKPRRIFVNSMSDLFHEKIPDEWIDRIFAVMALSGSHNRYFGIAGHTFQVLTKRPEEMRTYLTDADTPKRVASAVEVLADADRTLRCTRGRWPDEMANAIRRKDGWPLECVWLGVSVEDQATADERIPLLLQTPAAIRWVSYEPALAAVDFARWLPRRCGCVEQYKGMDCPACHGTGRIRLSGEALVDWLVVGGESGPDARPFDLAWARQMIAQCRTAGVRVFLKQLGAKPVSHDSNDVRIESRAGAPRAELEEHHGPYPLGLRDRKGGDPEEWPEDLRVREMPHDQK